MNPEWSATRKLCLRKAKLQNTLLNTHRIGLQVDTDGRLQRLPGRNVKMTIVKRTFNYVVQHEAARQVRLFMGAQPIRSVIAVADAIDRVGGGAVVETKI